MTERLTVRMGPELHAEVRRLAEKNGIGQAEVVRAVLARFLGAPAFREVPQRGFPKGARRDGSRGPKACDRRAGN